jgi:hypothetical protein
MTMQKSLGLLVLHRDRVVVLYFCTGVKRLVKAHKIQSRTSGSSGQAASDE